MSATEPKQVWRSSDVDPFRGFAYYREGICRSFMDLIPEPAGDADWDFSGSVESLEIGSGRLVRVVATSHLVLRTKAEIARAPGEFFYLNYKTRGECRIRQAGGEAVIRPGDVGLFDSSVPFALEHRTRPDLAVSSFMLPHDALRERLPGGLPRRPAVASDNPVLGHLIREAAATLAREADLLPGQDATRLYDLLLDLVAMAMTVDGRPRVDIAGSRAAAALLCVKTYIGQNYARAGLDASDVARGTGLSIRYLHKLFGGSGTTLGAYLRERRLLCAASALRSPASARMTIAGIAFANGFSDAAHFHRAFKIRFGCTASEWRFGADASTPGEAVF